MKISVIITSYNQSKYLKKIIESLEKQENNCEFEVIITDDGSKVEEISKIISIISSSKLEIYHIFQQDKGFRAGKARNNAIKLAKNELIILLDGDCIPKDNFLNEHLKLHENNENLLVYTNRDHGVFDNSCENKEEKIIVDKSICLRESIIKNNMKIWQRVWSFNSSFRKKEYTLFDENFFGYGLEDTEFAYRMLMENHYEITELIQPTVIHIDEDLKDISKSPFIVRKAEYLYNYINNAIYFYKKYRSDEIMNTFGNIPNFNEFLDPSFNFKDKLKNPTKQTIENLELQSELFKNFINK